MLNDGFIEAKLGSDEGKWSVLLFYPFDYTFVCPTEIISFSSKSEEFEHINTKVMAISTDSHHTHLSWTRTAQKDGGVGKLQIPLVADISKRISASYGVLVTDENDDMFGATLRGLFIVDPKGKAKAFKYLTLFFFSFFQSIVFNIYFNSSLRMHLQHTNQSTPFPLFS